LAAKIGIFSYLQAKNLLCPGQFWRLFGQENGRPERGGLQAKKKAFLRILLQKYVL